MTSHTPATETWTTRKLLAWMSETFTKKGLDSPRLLAEMLMAHVIGCDRLRLYMETDRPASPLERDTLRNLVTRALKHEPVQYLVGEAWFFGLPFHADRRALIPRPSTSTIVEEVLQHQRAVHAGAATKGQGTLIADLCTGSGCIAIALLKNLPEARAVATDVSPEALELAAKNAQRHGVSGRVDFVAGDLLAALDAHPVASAEASLDYLVSNPPYIPDDEWDAVAPNVKDHEPHLALRGGVDGLDLVRRLAAGAPRYIKPGGLLLVEVADSRAAAARDIIAASSRMADARIVKDFEGLPRTIVARRV